MASQKPDAAHRVADEIAIVPVRPDNAHVESIWKVLTELRPKLSYKEFLDLLTDSDQPLIYDAALSEGCCAAVVGWRYQTDSRIGRHAYVADLVVTSGFRGWGLGRAMIVFVAEESHRSGCTTLVLDSGITNTNAHQFYESIGFARTAFQFELSLQR